MAVTRPSTATGQARRAPHPAGAGDRAPRGALTAAPSASPFSCSSTSLADDQRSLGSFARHTDTSRSSAGGAAGRHLRDPRRFEVQNRADERGLARSRERALAGDHLVQHRAEGEDVGAGIDVVALQLLGRHVGQRAENLPVEGERRGRRLLGDAAGHLGQAEVEQLGAGLGEHHVARLQVAMHDPGAMREGQALGDLDRAGDRLGRRHRSLRQPRRQRLAVELLHHQEHRAVLLTDVVQRADVGMGERGDRRRFAFEAGPPPGIVAELPRQHLDGDAAIEPGVPGGVDLAHATGPQRIHDLVRAETRSGRQRHWPGGHYTSRSVPEVGARSARSGCSVRRTTCSRNVGAARPRRRRRRHDFTRILAAAAAAASSCVGGAQWRIAGDSPRGS